MRTGMRFPLFSWPHFSLDHKKHAECLIHTDSHLVISREGLKVDREAIKASIHRCYDWVYFEKLEQIIVNYTENAV